MTEDPLAAVLVDMDGLLVDSEPLWTVAEVELAERLGSTWTAQIKAAVVGTRLDVSVPTMLTMMDVGPDRAEPGEVTGWLLRRMAELYATDLPLMPGALDLLDALAAAAVPTALVSSSYRVLVDVVLAAVGRDRFAVTVAGDEVGRGKPDPQPYLTAAARLGVDPCRCVVLEDSLAGVLAGEAAGCVTVAVPTAVAPVPAGPGRVVIASLREASVAWLAGLVARRTAQGQPAT